MRWDLAFGCNYASLSLFRITLSIVLLIELLLRFQYLHAFYSDEGIVPTWLLHEKIDKLYQNICIHCRNGALEYQTFLLCTQVLFALFLLVGYKTKMSAFLSWFLYVSSTLRNTWLSFILDRYFHYLLFYSIFLPLNSSKDDRKIIISFATICLKLQILWIYLDAGMGKLLDPNQGWTFHASPLPALDTYARHTKFSRYFYALVTPFGFRIMTPLVVYLELGVAPLAILLSLFGFVHLVNILIILICFLHLGIALTIKNTYLLSAVACCAWCTYSHSFTCTKSYKTCSKKNMLYQYVIISSFIIGSIWFETVADQCNQSMEHIWSTLLHNRWNVFTGAEEYVTLLVVYEMVKL